MKKNTKIKLKNQKREEKPKIGNTTGSLITFRKKTELLKTESDFLSAVSKMVLSMCATVVTGHFSEIVFIFWDKEAFAVEMSRLVLEELEAVGVLNMEDEVEFRVPLGLSVLPPTGGGRGSLRLFV